LFVLLALLVLLQIDGIFVIPLKLLIGWVLYPIRAFPGIHPNWTGILMGAVCLLGVGVVTHWLLRWFWAHSSPPASEGAPRRWSLRNTTAVVVLIVFMFAAGIAALGVAHQIGWLINSPEPLVGRDSIARLAAPANQGNNLNNIGRAMWNYQEVNRTLPPAAIRDKQGRPLLSWRVLLLPHLEEENLYQEFHLDEPWDSPHNLRLLPRMPWVYLSPASVNPPPSFTTYYQVFVGKGTAFEGNQGLRAPDDFPDGADKTILVVEAATPVPWTKPEDLTYSAGLPLPALGHLSQDWFSAVLVDGSSRHIKRTVSETTLRNAITRNDGQPLGEDW
jgi:hypothetical protein